MNKKEFIEYLENLNVPDDADFCLSEFVTLEEEYYIIYDIPIIGTLYDKETNEVRFVCHTSSKECLEKLEIQTTIN